MADDPIRTNRYDGRALLTRRALLRDVGVGALGLTGAAFLGCTGTNEKPGPTAATTSSAAPTLSPTAAAAAVQRALVLGGGGVVGVAWETGMLKGLRDGGVDVTEADLIVGTSAGAIVGAQVRSGKALDGLYDALVRTAGEPPPSPGTDRGFDPAYASQTQQPIRVALATAAEVPLALRMQAGQRALAATRVMPEEDWINAIVRAYDIRAWPSRPLKLAACDVGDGTIRFFDRTQDAPIERAVAASSALPGQRAPITIGGRRYMDGFAGGDNIDGAAGSAIIVVLAPTSMSSAPRGVAGAQVDRARSQGSQVLYVVPDADARAAMGTDNADLTKRAPAVQAAARQGAAVAAQVKALWGR